MAKPGTSSRKDSKNERDVIEIKLANGSELALRFDITEFCRLSGHSKTSDDDGDDSPTIGR
jgi:hypothetical protein